MEIDVRASLVGQQKQGLFVSGIPTAVQIKISQTRLTWYIRSLLHVSFFPFVITPFLIVESIELDDLGTCFIVYILFEVNLRA